MTTEELHGQVARAATVERELRDRIRAAEGERDALKADRTGMKIRAADALADEVQVLIRRNVIDVRSPAGDALLDYRDPPNTERGDRLAAAEGALREAREEIVWAHACLRRVATKEHQDHVEIGTRSFGLLVGQQRIARIAAALREPQLGKPGAVAPRMVRACGACGGSGAIYETHDVGVTERIGCEECNATGFLPAPPPETP